jgi:DNA-binding response OmpR family regulator
MRIAVIEEERPIQDLVRHALELAGHRVDTYYQASEQLAPCDLVIIEPGEYGQGIPVVQQLREQKHIPVLILTFHERNVITGYESRIPVLRKLPFRLQHFFAVVNGLNTEHMSSQGVS